MACTPAISIVLTTYDRPSLLRRAIHSIRAQAFESWELILVVDGAPTPATGAVVEAFARRDPRIRPVVFRQNVNNPAMRMNQAMALASAPRIAFQDDDDVWYPNALADLSAGFDAHPDHGMVYGAAHFQDARTGARFRTAFALEPAIIMDGNACANNAVLADRDAIDAVGGFDESDVVRAYFDWDLWRRISARFPIARLDCVVGEVWAHQPDSVGDDAVLDYDAMDERVHSDRRLPLVGHWSRERCVVFLTHGHHPSLKWWRVDTVVDAIQAHPSPWRAAKVDVDVAGWEHAVQPADLVVLYRFHRPRPSLPDGVRVVFDLDDPIFEDAIPRHLMSAQAVTVSSRRLGETVARGNVFHRPNCVPADLLAERPTMAPGGRFTIAWLAGLNPNDDEDFVVDVACRVAAARPGIAFYYLGKSAALEARLRAVTGLVVVRDEYVDVTDLRDYFRRVRKRGISCVIVPLRNDALNRAKDVTKLLEAAILGVPVVASPVGAYDDWIDHGRNGYLARDAAAMAIAVLALATDPALASRLARRLRRDVYYRRSAQRVTDRHVLALEAAHARLGIDAETADPRGNSDAPALSIVIVTWNTRDLVVACLQSIREHPFREPTEVIVIDNGSNDQSTGAIARAFPEVTLIRNDDNLGYAAANNQGVEVARAPRVLFLNSDCEVTAGALDEMVDYLDRAPDAGAVTARFRYPDGRPQPSCMRFPTRRTALVWDTLLRHLPPGKAHIGRYLMRDFDHATSRTIDQAPGACLLIRRELLTRIGPFDPALVLYFNDVDLCRRIRAAGHAIHFLADVEIVHHDGASVRRYAGQGAAWHRDRARYYRKHFGITGRAAAVTATSWIGARECVRALFGPARGRRIAEVLRAVKGAFTA